jgi:hypothetical protein
MPVKCMEKDVLNFGLAPLYLLIGSQTLVISEREVYGRAAVTATFSSAPNDWLQPNEPAEVEQSLLSISTEQLPVERSGLRARNYQVIDIISHPPLSEQPITAPDDKVASPENEKKREPELEHLTEEQLKALEELNPFFDVALKQFMAAEDPIKACYQSLVVTDWEIKKVHEAKMLPHDYWVAIAAHEDSLVNKLKMTVDHTADDPKTGRPRDYLKVAYPFSIKATMTRSGARNLYYRAGTREWTLMPDTHVRPKKSSRERMAAGSEVAVKDAPSRKEQPLADIKEPIIPLLELVKSKEAKSNEPSARYASPRERPGQQ